MRDSFFEKYKTSEVTNTRRVINTPSAFTREHFFYIQEAGYLKSLKPHMSRRSGLQSYLFLIVLSGSGEVLPPAAIWADGAAPPPPAMAETAALPLCTPRPGTAFFWTAGTNIPTSAVRTIPGN